MWWIGLKKISLNFNSFGLKIILMETQYIYIYTSQWLGLHQKVYWNITDNLGYLLNFYSRCWYLLITFLLLLIIAVDTENPDRHTPKPDLAPSAWFENLPGLTFYITLGLTSNMAKTKMFGLNFSSIFSWDMYLKIYLCMLKSYKT